jgi:hypothetical protein
VAGTFEIGSVLAQVGIDLAAFRRDADRVRAEARRLQADLQAALAIPAAAIARPMRTLQENVKRIGKELRSTAAAALPAISGGVGTGAGAAAAGAATANTLVGNLDRAIKERLDRARRDVAQFADFSRRQFRSLGDSLRLSDQPLVRSLRTAAGRVTRFARDVHTRVGSAFTSVTTRIREGLVRGFEVPVGAVQRALNPAVQAAKRAVAAIRALPTAAPAVLVQGREGIELVPRRGIIAAQRAIAALSASTNGLQLAFLAMARAAATGVGAVRTTFKQLRTVLPSPTALVAGSVRALTSGFGVLRQAASGTFGAIRTGINSLTAPFRFFNTVLTRSIFSLKNLVITIAAIGLVKRANEVEAISGAFSTLAASVGALSSSLLEKLRRATRGTVSDLELMRSTNNAILLGVVRTEDQFAELAEAARRLGRAVGRDTLNALNDLSLGIGRQSRLILDNLGIIVRVDAAQEQYARSLGKTVGQLTETEKRTAFLAATTEGIRRKLANLGPDIETNADAWGRLGAAISNTISTIAVALVGGRIPNAIAAFLNRNRRAIGEFFSFLDRQITIGFNAVVTAVQRFLRGDLGIGDALEATFGQALAVLFELIRNLLTSFGRILLSVVELLFEQIALKIAQKFRELRVGALFGDIATEAAKAFKRVDQELEAGLLSPDRAKALKDELEATFAKIREVDRQINEEINELARRGVRDLAVIDRFRKQLQREAGFEIEKQRVIEIIAELDTLGVESKLERATARTKKVLEDTAESLSSFFKRSFGDLTERAKKALGILTGEEKRVGEEIETSLRRFSFRRDFGVDRITEQVDAAARPLVGLFNKLVDFQEQLAVDRRIPFLDLLPARLRVFDRLRDIPINFSPEDVRAAEQFLELFREAPEEAKREFRIQVNQDLKGFDEFLELAERVKSLGPVIAPDEQSLKKTQFFFNVIRKGILDLSPILAKGRKAIREFFDPPDAEDFIQVTDELTKAFAELKAEVETVGLEDSEQALRKIDALFASLSKRLSPRQRREFEEARNELVKLLELREARKRAAEVTKVLRELDEELSSVSASMATIDAGDLGQRLLEVEERFRKIARSTPTAKIGELREAFNKLRIELGRLEEVKIAEQLRESEFELDLLRFPEGLREARRLARDLERTRREIAQSREPLVVRVDEIDQGIRTLVKSSELAQDEIRKIEVALARLREVVIEVKVQVSQGSLERATRELLAAVKPLEAALGTSPQRFRERLEQLSGAMAEIQTIELDRAFAAIRQQLRGVTTDSTTAKRTMKEILDLISLLARASVDFSVEADINEAMDRLRTLRTALLGLSEEIPGLDFEGVQAELDRLIRSFARIQSAGLGDLLTELSLKNRELARSFVLADRDIARFAGTVEEAAGLAEDLDKSIAGIDQPEPITVEARTSAALDDLKAFARGAEAILSAAKKQFEIMFRPAQVTEGIPTGGGPGEAPAPLKLPVSVDLEMAREAVDSFVEEDRAIEIIAETTGVRLAAGEIEEFGRRTREIFAGAIDENILSLQVTGLRRQVRTLADELRQASDDAEHAFSTVSFDEAEKEIADVNRRAHELRRTLAIGLRGAFNLLKESIGDEAKALEIFAEEAELAKEEIEALDRAMKRLAERKIRLKVRVDIEDVKKKIDELQEDLEDFGLSDNEKFLRSLQRQRRDLVESQSLSAEEKRSLLEALDKQIARAIVLVRQRTIVEVTKDISTAIATGIYEGFLRGEKFSKIFATISAELFKKEMERAIDKLSTSLSTLVAKVFQGFGPNSLGGKIGQVIADILVSVVAIVATVLTNLKKKSEVVIEDFNEIVTSSEAVRGVVAGPTNVAIAQIGDQLREAMRGPELLLREIAEIGREVLGFLGRAGSGPASASAKSLRLTGSTQT